MLCYIINYINYFFFLILKEVKIFLRVPKSALGTVLIVPNWRGVPAERPQVGAEFWAALKRTKAVLGELSSPRRGTCPEITTVAESALLLSHRERESSVREGAQECGAPRKASWRRQALQACGCGRLPISLALQGAAPDAQDRDWRVFTQHGQRMHLLFVTPPLFWRRIEMKK